MLIPLGFLAGSGGGLDSDFELIETQILGSSQASITFSSLGTYSSTYKHLQIRLAARGSGSGTISSIYARLNGDTTSNYRSHLLFGNGSTVQTSVSTLDTQFLASLHANSGAAANVFGAAVIDILDAYVAKNKTIRSFGGVAPTELSFVSGLWMNTASLTSINLRPEVAGDWVTGSRFSLYGIKG
jgi:hypothetical protein